MMDTNLKPDDRPDWLDIWTKNLSQIDDMLIKLFHTSSEKAGDVWEQARAKVQDMLNHTEMDEQARAGWDKAKADGKLLHARIENRVEHLIADGKITLARLTKKQDSYKS